MPKLRDLVHQTSDAAFAVSEDLHVLAWNRQAELILGQTAAEAVGLRCFDVISAELPTGEPLCGPACHGGYCFRRRVPFDVRESVVRNRDGSPVAVRFSTMIISDDYGPVHQQTRALVFLHRLDGTAPEAALPQPLRIRALGPFSVTLNGRDVAIRTWARKSALTVLKLLAMHRGQVMLRDQLIEHLWPGVEEKRGRNRLKVAVYYLRHQLNSRDMIEFSDDGYVLRDDVVWMDTDTFEQHVRDGGAHARHGRLDAVISSFGRAMDLYRGDFLEENVYEDWCAVERERLRELYFDVAERLAGALVRQTRFEEAGQTCRSAIAREPCREVFHRILMECLLAMARPADAEQQFWRCREILARDLSVEPLPETRRLYERIRAARSDAP